MFLMEPGFDDDLQRLPSQLGYLLWYRGATVVRTVCSKAGVGLHGSCLGWICIRCVYSPPVQPKNVFLFILVFILVVATHWSIYIHMLGYYIQPFLGILLLSIVTAVFFFVIFGLSFAE